MNLGVARSLTVYMRKMGPSRVAHKERCLGSGFGRGGSGKFLVLAGFHR